MSGIFWLASYPKSGNTWLRILLTNYHRDATDPADINQLEYNELAASRELFEGTLGIPSSDLTHDQIDDLRPDAYRSLAAKNQKPIFLKVHDACTFLGQHRPMFPADASLGAIYIVRHPFDVAVSASSYFQASLETVTNFMGLDFVACDKSGELGSLLRQRILSWSHNVESWLEGNVGFPVLLLRYEDLYHDPLSTFRSVLEFLEWDVDDERIRRAVEFSKFSRLQRQENDRGFRERPGGNAQFFVRGRPGGGQAILSSQQREKLVSDHGAMMKSLAYNIE